MDKGHSPNLTGVPKCFCKQPASVCLSERSGTLIYDCHYVKHVNPWNSGILLEYDDKNKKTILCTVFNLANYPGKETTERSPQSIPFTLSTNSHSSAISFNSSISSTQTIDIMNNNDSNNDDDNNNIGDVESRCCKTKENRICGFHVHLPSWNKICNGRIFNANNRELSTCPFFNFTFCVEFQTINQYPINIPSVPRCYCKRPIVLTRITTPGNIGRWYMACASYHIPGAKPKCSFFKWADEVLYDKNDQCFHDDFYKFEQVFIREPTYQSWRKRLVCNIKQEIDEIIANDNVNVNTSINDNNNNNNNNININKNIHHQHLQDIQDVHINNRDDDNFLTSINNNFIHSSDPTRVKIAGLDF